jgi:hypothetical protein
LSGLKCGKELIWYEKRDTDIDIETYEMENVHSKDQKAETSINLFHQDI